MFLVKIHKLSVVTQEISKTVSLHKDYLSHIKCETISAFQNVHSLLPLPFQWAETSRHERFDTNKEVMFEKT